MNPRGSGTANQHRPPLQDQQLDEVSARDPIVSNQHLPSLQAQQLDEESARDLIVSNPLSPGVFPARDPQPEVWEREAHF